MFCSQCGAQLINGAKFCSNCGAAITSSGSSIQSSGEQITSNITIPVLSGSIILPLNVQESGRLFKEFKDLAVSKAKAHTNAFDSTYADLDAFISKSDSVITGIYLEFYQKALDYLKAQGIFSLSIHVERVLRKSLFGLSVHAKKSSARSSISGTAQTESWQGRWRRLWSQRRNEGHSGGGGN